MEILVDYLTGALVGVLVIYFSLILWTFYKVFKKPTDKKVKE